MTRGRLRRELFGAVIAADETVGVGIDGLGDRDRLTRHEDLDTAGGAGGVVAERDRLADERGVDFVDDAVETDGAIRLDPLRFSSKRKRSARSSPGNWTCADVVAQRSIGVTPSRPRCGA